MTQDYAEKLRTIPAHEYRAMVEGDWGKNDVSENAQDLLADLLKQPKLVIAPNFQVFQNYCLMHQLVCRGPNPQALYITRGRQLLGQDNLLTRLVIIGYPDTTTGKDMREAVADRLSIERARANRAST